jgi:hypothetical protein
MASITPAPTQNADNINNAGELKYAAPPPVMIAKNIVMTSIKMLIDFFILIFI